MDDFILANETTVRLSFFAGVFCAMALWELAAPRRKLATSRAVRWTGNLGIVVINTLILRLLFPVLAVGVAALTEARGWGLFNIIDAPVWLAVVASIVLLDLAIYLQHVMFHAVPTLWRLHMMHHADLDIDVTTGARFHPIEIVLSMLIKMGVVILLGAPALGVIVFEILLNATAMFNHANARLPLELDRVLRLVVVTPDMHRVHHSAAARETNSNFGFNLPWWDRLLGTYRAQPEAEHESMIIGLTQFRDRKRLTLPWMLALPFVGPIGAYPINRRGGNSD